MSNELTYQIKVLRLYSDTLKSIHANPETPETTRGMLREFFSERSSIFPLLPSARPKAWRGRPRSYGSVPKYVMTCWERFRATRQRLIQRMRSLRTPLSGLDIWRSTVPLHGFHRMARTTRWHRERFPRRAARSFASTNRAATSPARCWCSGAETRPGRPLHPPSVPAQLARDNPVYQEVSLWVGLRPMSPLLGR